ncbi:unnamed protein product [Ilex paraguariensis]|uniref:Uncharacterized protein n=1 Tax=Ilex paraguariensis TaxID=185542 RepID=A0ABC8RDH7_9AQUA
MQMEIRSEKLMRALNDASEYINVGFETDIGLSRAKLNKDQLYFRSIKVAVAPIRNQFSSEPKNVSECSNLKARATLIEEDEETKEFDAGREVGGTLNRNRSAKRIGEKNAVTPTLQIKKNSNCLVIVNWVGEQMFDPPVSTM